MWIKAISDDVALDRGIEFFYEVILYSILIGLPCWEFYKAHLSDELKKK